AVVLSKPSLQASPVAASRLQVPPHAIVDALRTGARPAYRNRLSQRRDYEARRAPRIPNPGQRRNYRNSPANRAAQKVFLSPHSERSLFAATSIPLATSQPEKDGCHWMSS